MKTLYTVGEMLIDFTAQETGKLEHAVTFRKNAGGAPANVAVCVSKLGGCANVITKLGKDAFGAFLEETLRKEGVGTDYVFTTDEANTALAFVSRDEKGERSFSFYRNPSADMLLNEDDVRDIPFAAGDILHFGSVDLCDAPVKKAHLAAIDAAREAGALISFDPNLRYSLWKSAEELLNTVRSFLPTADILKVSEEELFDITRIKNEQKAVESLFRGHVKIIFVTKGSDGAAVYTKEHHVCVPVDKSSPVVDTTGAGDSFIGTVLYQILERGGIEKLSEEELRVMLRYANHAATYVVAREGAIPAMPVKKEVF
ncbi:MAG: carbohydrate kinase [Clostridiales bacterium]|nr:carbohydrate kinase [Clostridiales bacterium]